jgi:glutaredoxin
MTRCEVHDLALPPSGLCILCRRHGQDEASRRWGVILAVVLSGVLGLGVFVVGVRTALDMARASRAEAAAAADPATAGQVKVYTTKWCPSCKITRAWLKDQKIDYVERDVEGDVVAAAEFRKLGSRTVPTFDIDGQVKVGFDPVWVKEAIAKSDARRAEQ